MNFNYCPYCGSKNSIEAKTETDYICLSCKQYYWNNPKAATAIIFMHGDELLYAKRGIEPDKGMYEFPGGFVNFGEDVYDCCAREVFEETGLKIHRDSFELLEVYTSKYKDQLSTTDIVFIVREWHGVPVAQDDVANLEWKPIDFIKDPEFIRPYHNLGDILQNYLNK